MLSESLFKYIRYELKLSCLFLFEFLVNVRVFLMLVIVVCVIDGFFKKFNGWMVVIDLWVIIYSVIGYFGVL